MSDAIRELLAGSDRPRRIVRLASTLVKSPMSKSWLFNDERGSWERDAAELLARAGQLMQERSIIATEEQVDHELAEVLALRALNAELERLKSYAAKPKALKPKELRRNKRRCPS